LACAESFDFLGVRIEDILWIDEVDTDTSLKDAVQTDSAVSLLLAEAMEDLAGIVKEKVLALAAPHFKSDSTALAIEAGWIYRVDHPQKRLTVKDLLWKHVEYVPYVPIVATISRSPSKEETGVPYQATFAEVDVDLETGVVKVLRMVVVNDVGTVLNPTGAESHQIGGQMIALGETLSEEIIYDRRTGTPLNFNFIDYKLLSMVDIPQIEPVLLEVWRGTGKYGASGMAEGTLTNTPGAVLNAIYNAIGVRFDHIPVRPGEILKGLKKGGAS
jgi:xanthine dehydrogenase molybdenum-binding subunit